LGRVKQPSNNKSESLGEEQDEEQEHAMNSNSLQLLRLRKSALVARQGRGQGEQAVDQEHLLVGGVQVGALVHSAQGGKKGRDER
jgi:hypothetical protein